MKVPFRIKRSTQARPVVALLLPSHDGPALLQVCACLRLDPPPRVFAVADGLLLRLHEPLQEPVAGLVRLAEIGVNLLLPVDAELIPTLLPDEAGALGVEGGLVFLPAGRVLEFDPHAPLPWSTFLRPTRWLRSDWQSLPEVRHLAEQLVEVRLDRPDESPETLLDAGGEGIGVEEPRPDDAPLPKKVLGKITMGVGQGLDWLGRLLGAEGIARAGAKAMAAGMAMFPRLSEKLLGKQEASLRELLREFLEGNIEKALRRAIPLNAPFGRGGFGQGAVLPVHDTRYSLSNIRGAAGGGGSLWLTSAELYYELERQYRMQAQEAIRRGDFRRAAFIYGKLLNDFRLAAATLTQGGLHHDAAIIYLKVLHDIVVAAREFEAAGDVDRALHLYWQQGEHIHAGDLLRRLGEEDLAVAEYLQAAEKLLTTGQGYHQAGELMLRKAGRVDLARRYFEAGWAQRGYGSSLACACALAQLHADQGDVKAVLHLVGEAEAYFAPPGNEAATADFFNHVASLAQQPALAPVREELHDRTLMALARKLGQNAFDHFRAGTLVPQMFPAVSAHEPLWPANFVTDAQLALRTSVNRGPTPPRPAASAGRIVIEGVISIVRAAVQCPLTEEIFLGFESGEIACFDPRDNNVSFLQAQPGPVEQLVFGGTGDHLVVLCRDQDHDRIACFERGPPWVQVHARQLDPPRFESPGRSAWLFPSLAGSPRYLVGLATDSTGPHFLGLPNLLPMGEVDLADFAPVAALLVPTSSGSQVLLTAFGGSQMVICASINPLEKHPPIPCPLPRNRPSTTLVFPMLQCKQFAPGHFELVALGAGGSLCWLRLHLKGNRLESHLLKQVNGDFLAATLVREGSVVGVDGEHVVHLRIDDSGTVKELRRLRVGFPFAVACFACQRTQELFVLSGDGSLMRGRWLP